MIYVVRPGDTLWAISRRSGIPTADIARLNQIPDPGLLLPGQTLLLQKAAPEGRPDLDVGGYAYPFLSPWVLTETLPFLTLLSAFSYGFLPDGTLLPPPLCDRWMVHRAAEAGARAALVLTPMDRQGKFSNALIAALLENDEARLRLLQQLQEKMAREGFSELNIDFEYIRAEDKDRFTGFVEQASGFLGCPVTVCLAPKTDRNQRGLLYEGKDYAALGQAAHRLLLMTYEWGYKYGPPMAVAPLGQVRRVVEYALTEIPAEKLRLGLPNYGYDWPLPFVPGKTAARTLGLVEAVELARQVRTNIIFDRSAMAPWFRYTDCGTEHVVWFEDLRSWQAKFDLVREYGLAGVGIWTVMRLYRPGLALLAENFPPA